MFPKSIAWASRTFRGSQDRLASFLRTQLHMLHGNVSFCLPICVMLLKNILDSTSPVVSSFLRNPGSKLLDDISVALTNKLDGEMWRILPILHYLQLSECRTHEEKGEQPGSRTGDRSPPLKVTEMKEAEAVLPKHLDAKQASPDENRNASNTIPVAGSGEKRMV